MLLFFYLLLFILLIFYLLKQKSNIKILEKGVLVV